MPLKRQLIIAIMVAASYWAVAEEPYRPMYSARGSLEFQTVRTNDAVSFEQTWLFEIMEDSAGRWKLEIHTKYPDPKLPVTTTEAISYDRTNIYSVTYSKNMLETLRSGPPKLVEGTNRHPARISTGPYPIDHSSAVGVIWLAFLGAEYLPHTEKKVQFPNLSVPSARTDPLAWSCDFEFDLTQGGDHPVINYGQYQLNPAYLLDSSVSYPELDEPENDYEVELWQSRMKEYRTLKGEALMRFSYRLIATTNLGGVLIPKAFHCEWASPAGLNETSSMEGLITSVSAQPTATLLPGLVGAIDVQDRRFRGKDKKNWRRDILYPLDQQTWITDTNDFRLVGYLSQYRMIPIQKVSMRARYFNVVVILFIVLILAPIALISRRRFITPKGKGI